MKLIIDIPEDMYQTFHNTQPRMGDAGMDSICQAIGNGTPLDDIKAEIEKKCDAFEKCNAYECANGLNWALKMIDKHMAERSDKE